MEEICRIADQRLVRHRRDMSEEEGDERLVRHGRHISSRRVIAITSWERYVGGGG